MLEVGIFLLIADKMNSYEMPIIKNKYRPDYAVPPMETIKEIIAIKNISVSELADMANIDETELTEVMELKREIDLDIAKGLERAIGIPKSFWINLENSYQADLKRLNQ